MKPLISFVLLLFSISVIAQIEGEPCNDGNPTTENDQYVCINLAGDLECQGTPIQIKADIECLTNEFITLYSNLGFNVNELDFFDLTGDGKWNFIFTINITDENEIPLNKLAIYTYNGFNDLALDFETELNIIDGSSNKFGKNILFEDFDGDGDMDVFYRMLNNGNSQFFWVENINAEFGEAELLLEFEMVNEGLLHDFKLYDSDNDGDLDLFFVTAPESSGITRIGNWYENFDNNFELFKNKQLNYGEFKLETLGFIDEEFVVVFDDSGGLAYGIPSNFCITSYGHFDELTDSICFRSDFQSTQFELIDLSGDGINDLYKSGFYSAGYIVSAGISQDSILGYGFDAAGILAMPYYYREHTVKFGDVDGNGFKDLIMNSFYDHGDLSGYEYTVFNLNFGLDEVDSDTLVYQSEPPTKINYMGSADLMENGMPITFHGSSTKNYYFAYLGNGSFTENKELLVSGNNVHALNFQDFDKDEDLDIIGIADGNLVWLINNCVSKIPEEPEVEINSNLAYVAENQLFINGLEETVLLQIYNVKGELVIDRKIHLGSHQIKLSSLNTGMYSLVLKGKTVNENLLFFKP